jgi:hypothetical protein
MEQEAFENPPLFNSADQNKFFEFSLKIIRFMKRLKTTTNQVCFLVIFGYFKATKRFFSRKFYQKDISFIAKKYGFVVNQIKLDSYEETTYRRHKKIILEHCGFREFNEESKQILIKEISSIIRSQLRVKLILIRTIEILINLKIEIPSYTIANLIVEEIKI